MTLSELNESWMDGWMDVCMDGWMDPSNHCCLHPSQVVGVAQAINKKSGEDGAFTEQDEKVGKVQFHLFGTFC